MTYPMMTRVVVGTMVGITLGIAALAQWPRGASQARLPTVRWHPELSEPLRRHWFNETLC